MNYLLRYGSHSEKEYFQKMLPFFDGVIFSSSLLESTPSATISLMVNFSGEKLGKQYLLDPMTYTFGEFYEYTTGNTLSDLSWLKSTTKKGFTIKKSYAALGERLGATFKNCVTKSKALSLADLKSTETQEDICKSVINYQVNRPKELLKTDTEFADYADSLPSPFLVLVPYFHIQPAKFNEWIDLHKSLATISKKYHSEDNLCAQFCFDYRLLERDDFIEKVISFHETGVKNLSLWASDFNEKVVPEKALKGFIKILTGLKEKGISVHSRHGGYFSLVLSKLGLDSISHGVGYGEQKDIMPVLGQATPTIQYYYPTLHDKYGVPDVQRAFSELQIKTPADFFKKICSCTICKGVIRDNIDNFSQYGEMHKANENSKRRTQTPAAAKRARYHFLLVKIKEYKFVKENDLATIKANLETSISGTNFDLFQRAEYLNRWKNCI